MGWGRGHSGPYRLLAELLVPPKWHPVTGLEEEISAQRLFTEMRRSDGNLPMDQKERVRPKEQSWSFLVGSSSPTA